VGTAANITEVQWEQVCPGR